MDYRTVFIVSDLHLGGYTGVYDGAAGDWAPLEKGKTPGGDARSFRIFRDAEALAWAIDNAGTAAGPVALILNGDIVDFLAMPEAKGFDPEGARDKIEHIIGDPEQRPVWEALRRFITSDDGDLVLVLGNHDIELAMHDAGAFLIDYLTDGVAERGQRIIHCYNGKGLACSVGGARVLAVHGNAVDPWNEIDYSLLAEYAEARRLKTRVPKFRVNAGSTLVVEHMNAVKRRFQWIDLLKPEQRGAALVAATLDKNRGAPISLLAENLFTRGWAMRRSLFVGEEPDPTGPMLPPRTADDGEGPGEIDIDAALRDAQEKDAAGITPAEVAGADDEDGVLSIMEMAPALVKLKIGRPLREVLREYLAGDRTYDFTAFDETYRDLDRATDPDVDFLIAGHTHLERSLARQKGRGHYFNSGTWIKLVSMPNEVLATDEAFAPVKDALEDGSIEILERPIRVGARTVTLIRSIRTVVKIEALEAGGARGVLCHVEGEHGSFSLKAVAGSERTVHARRPLR